MAETAYGGEIINRTGGMPGNPLGFTIAGNGETTVKAYNGQPVIALGL